MYAIIKDGLVVEFPIHNLRQRFPQVSFPETISAASLPSNVVPVTHDVPPTVNEAVEKPVLNVLPELILGSWKLTYRVVPLTLEEILARGQQAREAAKAERAAAVEAIAVTTAAGNTFDGDEVSQTRMTRAILVLNAIGAPSIKWVLADNSEIQATAAELTEALALAGAAQAAIWVL